MAVQKILKSTQKESIPMKRRRVAAYCRVSTELLSQQTSMDLQVAAYRERICSRKDWEFAGVYADEGISGTCAARRSAFLDMIRDCEAGKIDYIITKSISRFARNTLECLSYIRRLQEMGVQICFEKENIDTGQPFSEMLLTILAAFAQEESRSLSENLKWGIRKRYQEGMARWSNIFGYTRNNDECYIVVPEEAEVVRYIFDLYEKGLPMARLGRQLMKEGHKTPRGGSNWDATLVKSILDNEKYVGDILLQKRYTVDHLTHRTRKNDQTVVPSYYIRDHHQPIISRKTFERVQRIRGLRSKRGTTVQYPFADMLHCPFCGGVLRQSKLKSRERGWQCDACPGFLLKSKVIESAMLAAHKAMAGKTEFSSVEYYWLDDLVESIEICEENELHVCWKNGHISHVPLVYERKGRKHAHTLHSGEE